MCCRGRIYTFHFAENVDATPYDPSSADPFDFLCLANGSGIQQAGVMVIFAFIIPSLDLVLLRISEIDGNPCSMCSPAFYRPYLDDNPVVGQTFS
jgi:hypothetical protein